MADPMSSVTLRVVFSGPALDGGTMDVRDLAPALLALGRLCEEANRVVNQDRGRVAVRVRADFTAGSFEVALDLVQTIVEQMRSLLLGDDLAAAEAMITWLGLVGTSTFGLVKLIKRLRGRKPDRLTRLDSGAVRVEFEGDHVEVPREVVELYRDMRVRKAASDMVRPVEAAGIDSIEFRTRDAAPGERVTKADLAAFAPPTIEDEQIVEEERRAAFKIVSLAFKDDNKWRLSDGQNPPIAVTMADQDFLTRIEANEIAFAKGDLLICRLRTTQWRVGEDLKTDYTVLQVIEHRSAARQLSLPLNPPPKRD